MTDRLRLAAILSYLAACVRAWPWWFVWRLVSSRSWAFGRCRTRLSARISPLSTSACKCLQTSHRPRSLLLFLSNPPIVTVALLRFVLPSCRARGCDVMFQQQLFMAASPSCVGVVCVRQPFACRDKTTMLLASHSSGDYLGAWASVD
jgi:hypothetical protein